MVSPPEGSDGMAMGGGMSAESSFPAGTVTNTDLAMLPAPPVSLETVQASAPPAKRRKLKGLDTEGLAKLLSGLHGCLDRMVEGFGEEASRKEVPVEDLAEEFERHWRLRFDAKSMGEPSNAAFLRRFPAVFHVRLSGVHTVVAPRPTPDFQQAAVSGLERPFAERELASERGEFAVGAGESTAAMLANLVAEERKSIGAPLPFQFAHFEVVQDLLTRLRDGAATFSRDEGEELVKALLDPKPPQPKQEPPSQRDDDRDRRDDDRLDSRRDERDRDDFLDRDRDRRDDRRGPPPSDDRDRRDDYHHHNNYRGGGGKGRRGGGGGEGGKSLCRQFQSGHCSYGDSCRFSHARDGRRY